MKAAAVGAGVVVVGFAAVGAAFVVGLAVEARQRRIHQAVLMRRPKR